MAKLKTPLLVAVVVAGLAFAALMAWKAFFDPYIAPPPIESGAPEAAGAAK